MARRLLFWLFVTKMKIPPDNDGLLSGFLLANAASAESGDQPEVGKWFCQYCRALFDDGGRWMVMLDNNLYLVSVVWFLRRSRVDRGTRGGKVVVGTDLSKQKVQDSLLQLMRLIQYHHVPLFSTVITNHFIGDKFSQVQTLSMVMRQWDLM